MKEMNSASPNELAKRFSFIRMLIVYIAICGVGITVLLINLNGLIRSHDKTLTGDICSLVTEKMNNSINYMTNSVENMAAVLTAEDHYDLQNLYNTISRDKKGTGYVSIGVIDENNKIYASDIELAEFEKWDLLETAKLADPVSISAPYRSGEVGEPVFSMFTHFSYAGGKIGYLFLTYPLKEIQNIAYTESLTEDAEIWLMEAASDNIIQCAGSNKYAIGSWNNALLSIRQQIDSAYQDDYSKWKSLMSAGEDSANISYKINGVTYTQVYSKIDFMHGWYVVVRIPSQALSSAIQQFRESVIIFMTILLITTVIMFILFHRHEAEEKRVLENLSVLDPLTSVMNRRAFDFTAEQYFGKSLKNEASLLFFDVDYFKQVNDRFGHEAGDRILKGFSAALREIFGNEGYISRYGGDEFVVLLKNGDVERISTQLKNLQKKAGEVKPADDSAVCGDFKLTFSCGAAVFPKDASDLKSLESCADSALYIVKKKGRNDFGWFKNSDTTERSEEVKE